MATTIAYQSLITYVPNGYEGSQPIFSAPIGGTASYEGALVKTPTGIVPCTANDASTAICGIIQHDSARVFAQQDTGIQGVFGSDQVNTGLFPATPGQALVATLGPPIMVIGNLPATTGWISGGTNQATYGTSVGIGLSGSGASAIYYFDDQASNKVGTIQGVITLDGNMILGVPTAATPISPTGLLGARVLVSFLTTVLNPITGR